MMVGLKSPDAPTVCESLKYDEYMLNYYYLGYYLLTEPVHQIYIFSTLPFCVNHNHSGAASRIIQRFKNNHAFAFCGATSVIIIILAYLILYVKPRTPHRRYEKIDEGSSAETEQTVL